MRGGFVAGGVALVLALGCGASEDVTTQLQDCKAQLDGLSGQTGTPTLRSESARLLGPAGPELRSVLSTDPEFAMAYNQELIAVKSNADSYAWVRSNNERLTQHRMALAAAGLDPAALRVATWVGVEVGDPTAYDVYRVRLDAGDGLSCARGPMGLTWRQAVRLGVPNARIDVVVSDAQAVANDRAVLEPLLEGAATSAGHPIDLAASDTIAVDSRTQADDHRCVYAAGTDGRDTYAGLPGNERAVLQRLLKLSIADWPTEPATPLDGMKTPSAQLAAMPPGTESSQAFTRRQVAHWMASAVVLPCLGTMANDEPPQWMRDDAGMVGDSKIACAVLLFLIDEAAAKLIVR